MARLAAGTQRSFDLRQALLEHWGEGGRFDRRLDTEPESEVSVMEALPVQLRVLNSGCGPTEQSKAVAAIKIISTRGLERPSSAIVDLDGVCALVELLGQRCAPEADRLRASSTSTSRSDQLLLSTIDTLRSLTRGSMKNTFAVTKAGAVEHFVKLLEHANVRVRKQACGVLSAMADENVGVQHRIRNEAGVPCLVNLLDDPDQTVRSNAALTLRRIGALPPKQPTRGHDPWEFLQSL
eukprot:TRINITY_DN3302_c0_g1_i4.p1 TRINITY_DN3302_c0_g1~~TRINITY_DN3302_c0_g1_i4.p1  ORF type:complete len:238 (-),score=43.87 TRINITY_DN3302_c0_g1_i4:232-945(-)